MRRKGGKKFRSAWERANNIPSLTRTLERKARIPRRLPPLVALELRTSVEGVLKNSLLLESSSISSRRKGGMGLRASLKVRKS